MRERVRWVDAFNCYCEIGRDDCCLRRISTFGPLEQACLHLKSPIRSDSFPGHVFALG